MCTVVYLWFLLVDCRVKSCWNRVGLCMIPIEGVAIYKLHTALFFVSCNDGLGTTCTYAISIIKIFSFCFS